jgi:P-type Cu2+ transporter
LPAVRDVAEQAGGGVFGQVLLDGAWREVRLGKPAFAIGRTGDTACDGGSGVNDANAGRLGDVPTTDPRIWLTLDGAFAAAFDLAETLRPEAHASIARLQAEGIATGLLSGDAASRVAAIAARVGVRDLQAGASPEDKLQAIRERQRQGQRVAMVGDGINDAPVLAAADVSIAFATGAALAQHQADFLVLSQRLEAIVEARVLARRTMRVVRENLGFAMLYNAISIPLAMAGLVPPWLAGLGMAASSVVVVANALRVAGRPARAPLVPAPTLDPAQG